MLKKINFLKLKIKLYFSFRKIIFCNIKYSILYLEIISLSIIFSIVLPNMIDLLQLLNYLPVYDFNRLKDFYTNLYVNTGISLIGLSGLIFTFKTFKKQSLDEYMNSIFQKMFIAKLDTYIEYAYVCIVSISFLLIPNLCIFDKNISFFVCFYYFSLLSILSIFGIELFIISDKMNKQNILKEIKIRVKLLYEIGEKNEKYYNEYSKKYNNEKLPDLYFINSMNYTFLSHIQCINLIVKKSFDDPLIFVNGMDTLYEITKCRLDIRKNRFNDYLIPLLYEIMPNGSNDTFIENYLLEYMDDYAKLSLEQRNKDNMGTIERMYKKLLLAGKDNRYINNDKLELTIQIIFIYYLKMINDIVRFNNENMLFQTIEIFKELFLNNGKYFNELVDKKFCNSMYQLSIESLKNKSLMNYRNIQGLLSIGMTSVLFSESEYRNIYLDEVFNTLKLDLEVLYNCRSLINEYDGARLYLNYMLNPLDNLSLLSIFRFYYNNNIYKEDQSINLEFLERNDFERLLSFISDKDVMMWLIDLRDKRYYVTCNTSINEICAFLLQISAITYVSVDNQEIKETYYRLFNNTLRVINKYINGFNKKNGMVRYELDEFYSNIVNLSENIITKDEKLKFSLFDAYKNSIFELYDSFEKKVSIEDFFGYFDSIYKIFDLSERKVEFKKIFQQIANNLIGFKKLIVEYMNLKHQNTLFIGFEYSEVRRCIEPILLEFLISQIDTMSKNELESIYSFISKEKSPKKISKKELLKMIKEIITKK